MVQNEGITISVQKKEETHTTPIILSWQNVSIGILSLFFVVGVPVIINEVYKAESGYITVWTASDVLAYYGTIIGAAVAIGTLCFTIQFTHRQIQRENYIHRENEKWKGIEKTIQDCIDIINPLTISLFIAESQSTNIMNGDFQEVGAKLAASKVNAQIALDKIMITLAREDLNRIDNLIKAIIEAQKYYIRMVENYFQMYGQAYAAKELSDRTVLLLDGLNRYNDKIHSNHDTKYAELLTSKQAAFSDIYAEIDRTAEKYLHK